MEIENILVGSLLQKPEIIGSIAHIVDEDDFEDNRAAIVFKLAKDRFIKKEVFDFVTAATLLPDYRGYLTEVCNVVPIKSGEYARLINDEARTRRLKSGLKLIQEKGDRAENILDDIATLHKAESRSTKKKYNIASVTSRIDLHIEENRKRGDLPGIKTGFDFLNDIYVRYVPGHIWIITGYTSVGKSKMLIEKSVRIPRSKQLVISTEMSEIQIMQRYYSRLTGISDNVVFCGGFDGVGAKKIAEAREFMLSMDIKIVDDINELSVIEALIRQESMQNQTEVVFIDYVQNCNIRGVAKKDQGIEMAGRLQQLAKQIGTTIICFSQVSNSVGRGDVEQFEAKGAGEWAAVADVGVRLKRNKDDQYLLLYDMQKGRHYRTIAEELSFSDNYTRINERVAEG